MYAVLLPQGINQTAVNGYIYTNNKCLNSKSSDTSKHTVITVPYLTYSIILK